VYVAPNDIPGNEAHGEPNRTLDSVSENDDDVPPPPPSASGARLLWGGSRASEKTRVSPDDLPPPPSPLSGGKARGVAGSDHSEEPSDYVAPASIPVGPGQFVSGAAVRGLHTYVPPTGEGDDDDGQPRVAFEKGDRMIVLEVEKTPVSDEVAAETEQVAFQMRKLRQQSTRRRKTARTGQDTNV
jgi:hypothetical protein